ncbi:MAG: WD40 repeat domain-containing protein, partial [Gemmataceae bacterium]
AAIEGSKVQVCNAEQNLGGAEQWLGKPLEHPYPVTQMAFSPDGTLLLTSCCEDKGLHPRAEVRLWDVARGTQIGESIAQESAGALSFSPDAKTFVTADLSGLVKVWRTPDTRIGK